MLRILIAGFIAYMLLPVLMGSITKITDPYVDGAVQISPIQP